MSGPLRRGRAVLQRVLCTSSSNLHQPVSSEYLQSNISACVRTADNQLAQPAFFSRFLGHTSWQAAIASAENCTDQALDAEALQTRRVSGSSASTSSSSFTPPAGRTPYCTRHFSSSRDASSAEGPVKDTSPSLKGRLSRHSEEERHGRSRYPAKRAGSADAAAEGSASASSKAHAGKRHVVRNHGSAAMGRSGSSARSAAAGDADSAQSSASSSQQSSHRAGRGRDREAPPEIIKSKRTRQLEAMAAEMLPEDEQKGAQPAAPQRQRLAGQLKFPQYHQVDERAAAFLKSGEDKLPLEVVEKNRILAHLNSFGKSAKMRNAALALYVNAQLFPIALQDFRQWIMRGMDEQLRDALMAAEPGEAEDALFNLFARYVLANFNDQIKLYSETIKMLDLRKPHLWYPMARALQRRLVYHKGPTNSGKTYNALRAMRSAPSGVYCGPLRLLAMEVYDELNASGTHCNLTTGQERSIIPTAQHTACTIEMTNLLKRVDVAVIDEIQQIGDEQRGWAWTRALQGVPANEIHLCGDGSALPLVRRLAAEMNEPLEVHEYERFTPLMVESRGLERGYLDVQPGDCVVAFSRKDIYDIKQLIEAGTGQRVCVVYGALPPEMRRTQARLFNDPDSGYDVLVASDAVGMGLNLNIRRIIFHTLSKFENGHRVPISISQIKQIGGRAGRRSSQFGMGLATCLNAADTERLQEALDAPLDAMSTDSAGLFPEFEQLEAFAGAQLEDSFHSILKRFAAEAQIDGTYMFCKQESVIQAAKFLSSVSELSLQERFWFCMAPANLRNPVASAALMRFAQKYAARKPVGADIHFSQKTPTTSEEMCEMEAVHQVISLWIWLSYRFPEEYFPGRDNAVALGDRVIGYMSEGLERMFGPTAAIVNPQARRAACEKLATWTNGAKDASEVAELVAGPDIKLPALWNESKVQRGTQLEVA